MYASQVRTRPVEFAAWAPAQSSGIIIMIEKEAERRKDSKATSTELTVNCTASQ